MDTDDETVRPGSRVLLTYKGQELAVLDVQSRWRPDKAREARACYGTDSPEHPGVRMLQGERGQFYLGGRVRALELPRR